MSTPPQTFKWLLWPTHGDLSGAFDEFVAEGFRVRLMGNALELSFEGSSACSPDTANALAVNYIEALNKHVGLALALVTEDEFLARTTPPFGMMTVVSSNRESRIRVARGLREARNELLASADQALRRCYDYLQDAREHARALNNEAAAYRVQSHGSLERALRRYGEDCGCPWEDFRES